MEEKKLDLNSIIGFILIFGILVWIMFQNQPTDQEIAAEKAKKEQQIVKDAKSENAASAKELSVVKTDTIANDSLKLKALQGTLGSFAYSATLPSAKSDFTTIENKLVSLKIANKGGYIVEAKLKNFSKITKDSGELVELIKNNNADLNIKLQTRDNRTLDTKNMYFEPTLTTVAGNQV